MTDRVDINGLPKGSIIQIRNDTPQPETHVPAKSPESERIPDGLYRVLGPNRLHPGYQHIELLGPGYLLTKAHEHLIVAAWDSGEDDEDPDWYRGLIDPPDDDDDDPDDDGGLAAPVPVAREATESLVTWGA